MGKKRSYSQFFVSRKICITSAGILEGISYKLFISEILGMSILFHKIILITVVGLEAPMCLN